MPWLSMPATWPTNMTTYWVRMHWWHSPFQAIFLITGDPPGWALIGPDPPNYVTIPWFLALSYRAL